MVHEKTFILAVGREAKIIVRGKIIAANEVSIDFEFLIREGSDAFFRPPIGPNHPQYWKLRKSATEKSQILQLEYSGISRKQLKAAITEFKQLAGPGFTFTNNMEIEERTKYLKGIRINALNRRMLALS